MELNDWHKLIMIKKYKYIVGCKGSLLQLSGGKESASIAGDLGSIPGSGRSFGEGNGNPLQYSYLENLMDRGAWRAIVHGSQRVRHD